MLPDLFQKLKSNLNFNPSFDATIQQNHNAIRSVIENNGHKGIATKLIGSLQRKTRIPPKPDHPFDIDILVELGSFERWASGGVTPQLAMDQLHQIVSSSDRYDAMNPQTDSPTVSFEYDNGVKVELVAAYRDNIGHSPNGIPHSPKGRGYWVVNRYGGWELADYDHEADYVSTQNNLADGLLVPTIKMLKAIKREYFSDMKSFHLEILASQIIPSMVYRRKIQGLPVSYPYLIADFFNQAPIFLSQPAKIPDSLSPRVSLSSIENPKVLNMMTAIQGHCNGIFNLSSETAQKAAWRELFGDLFPTS